jgi:hypothetical protein
MNLIFFFCDSNNLLWYLLNNLCVMLIFKQKRYQSLVGSVMVDAELGSEDHSSILATGIGRRLKPRDFRTDSEPG